jgi:hypothetical protein
MIFNQLFETIKKEKWITVDGKHKFDNLLKEHLFKNLMKNTIYENKQNEYDDIYVYDKNGKETTDRNDSKIIMIFCKNGNRFILKK